MSSNEQKRILIAPLDWGLGHTTRCVPILRWLLDNGHQPVFAGNEWQRRYIDETISGIETIHLEGYNVSYSRKGSGFLFSLLYQTPGLLRTIRREKAWLQELASRERLDAVISDNRYGLFHHQLPSVIMTHQLMVQTGLGQAADRLLRSVHYRYLNRFGQCWVVDTEGPENLSGILAHPAQLPAHTRYIGLLSQLAGAPPGGDGKHLLVLLSGPEPQRTLLSEILWAQASRMEQRVVFVAGSDRAAVPEQIPSHIRYYRQLTRADLLPLLQDASIVICRSGYSTIMDLVALGKKAIIIPTPGQTEQEYLARHLHKEGVFYQTPQHGFDLEHALRDSMLFPFIRPAVQEAFGLHREVLSQWIQSI